MANLSRTFSTRAAAFSYLPLFDGPTPFLRLTGPRSHRAGRGFQLGGWVPFPQASLQRCQTPQPTAKELSKVVEKV